MIAELWLIKSLDNCKKHSSLMIPSAKSFIILHPTLCRNNLHQHPTIHIKAYDLILLILIAVRPCFLIHIIFLSHSDHTCCFELVPKNSFFKNGSAFVSLNYRVEQVQCLSSLCLGHLMRSSLHSDEDYSWVDLFEARMLRIGKPRITT